VYRSLALLLGAAVLLLPGPAQAWWNGDWAYRKKLVIDAGAAGIEDSATELAVPVRLHTGNFIFLDMKPDGADLRFVAADDRTPLRHHIEKLDQAAEIAIVWVQLPKVSAGASAEFFWMYYGNPKAVPADDSAGTYPRSQMLVMHFNENDGMPRDQTAYANHASRFSGTPGVPGVIDTGVQLAPAGSIVIPASPGNRVASAKGFSFSTWIRLDAADGDGMLFTQLEGGKGIEIGVRGDQLAVRLTAGQRLADIARAGQLTVGRWHHLAVTLADEMKVYIDGKQSASAPASVPDLGGDLVIGAPPGGRGVAATLDEVQIASLTRSADWLKFAAASQSPDGQILAYAEDEETGGGSTYLEIYRVLANAVTIDGWVIITLVFVMGIVAANVIIGKWFALARMEKASARFAAEFRKRETEMLAPARAMVSVGAAAVDPAASAQAREWQRHSPLYRVFQAALGETRKTFEFQRSEGRAQRLSSDDLAVVRSTLEASMVQEAHAMNNGMVTLTVTVSGAPFLGLLGTVVGIMMTFGAVAAVGDVNVNTIAPGVAAAIATTVAGLVVAIPVMFAYNFLATKVRLLTSDMEVFANEVIGKLGRAFGEKG
jgi:biopolymer transport protein ExbB